MTVGNETQVSVVVPAWNREDTIRRCLDSLFAQDFEGLEVVVVDDGSMDGTADAALEYAGRYGSSLLRRPRGGVAVARRDGFRASRGEWMLFVDSDDYVAPDMVRTLYEATVCGWYRDRDGVVMPLKVYEGIHPESGADAMARIVLRERSGSGALWNKLMRRSLLREEDFTATEGIRHVEDFLLVTLVLRRAERVVYVPDILYYYVHTTGSVTAVPSFEAARDIFNVAMFIHDLCLSSGVASWRALAPSFLASEAIYPMRLMNRKKSFEAREEKRTMARRIARVRLSEATEASVRVKMELVLLKAGLFYPLYTLCDVLGLHDILHSARRIVAACAGWKTRGSPGGKRGGAIS